MNSLFVHKLDFEYYDSCDLVEVEKYLHSAIGSDYLILYSGDMTEDISSNLEISRCYKLVKTLPNWQMAYLCALLAICLKKSKVVFCEPILDTRMDLSEISEEAGVLLVLLSEMSDLTLFDEHSSPCIRKVEEIVDSISQDLARTKLRAIVNFIKLTQEITGELVLGKNICVGAPIPNLFEIVKHYRGVRPDFLNDQDVRQNFPEPVRELENFFRFLRMLAQNLPNTSSIDDFPDCYVVLTVFFEINSLSAKRSGDGSLYLLYVLRSVDLLLSGRLIGCGVLEFGGNGKLFLSSSGRTLWEAHSHYNERTPKTIEGLGAILRLAHLAELIEGSLYKELSNLVSIRNSLKHTHGFTKLDCSEAEHVCKVYMKLKRSLLTGSLKGIYDGIFAIINCLTCHNVVKSYFETNIQGSWIIQVEGP